MLSYILMRKNDPICALSMTEEGAIIKYYQERMNMELAPLTYKKETRWIASWWNDRSVPITQGHVLRMLREKGYSGASEYLFKNLGLSLTDYYWLRPADSNLKWEDVNLFDNDFKEDLLIKMDENSGYTGNGSFKSLTPNSTLKGQIEKSWQIRKGKRLLVKGNTDDSSVESLNECFASLLHEKQGYDNYTKYNLLRIKNKPYDFGCYSELFASQEKELVSAWDVLTSKKKPGHLNDYEHFIEVCGEHGIDTIQLRKDLEYQIMTDFIMCQKDRHFNQFFT